MTTKNNNECLCSTELPDNARRSKKSENRPSIVNEQGRNAKRGKSKKGTRGNSNRKEELRPRHMHVLGLASTINDKKRNPILYTDSSITS